MIFFNYPVAFIVLFLFYRRIKRRKRQQKERRALIRELHRQFLEKHGKVG